MAQSQEPPSTLQVSSKNDTQQITEEIKARQKTLKKESSAVASRLATAKIKEQSETVKRLGEELEIIDQLNVIYDQQISVLEQLRSLEVNNKHFQEEMASLQAESSSDQHFSFMELDQLREELNMQLRREKTLTSKIELADTALQQTAEILQKKQDRLKQVEAAAPDGTASVAIQPEINLQIARRAVELADQTQTLRQMELRHQKKAKAVLQTHIALLSRQVEFLQTHAEFSQEELREQLQRIDKEEFELNRALARAREQQAAIKSRLERSQKKLAAAAPDEQNRLEPDTEALRLAFEELKTKIDTTTRRIELLADWKSVWQRRYAVFNLTVEQAMLPKWRDEAKLQLTQIDQEVATSRLWLADWQSHLITLTNKIDSGQDSALEERRPVIQQRDHVQHIVEHLQDLHTALENSRRLQTKLIDEINTRTSQRTWRDWIDLAIHYQIYENTLLDWTYALSSALLTFALLFFLRWILIRRLKHLEEPSKASLANGFLTSVKRANSFFFLMIAVSIASLFLTLAPETSTQISRLTKVAFVFQATVWGSSFVRIWVFNILARKTKRDGASMGALSIFNFSSQVILWSIAVLLILQNLGIDVTALVAGLGIGGVAVALSLQRILNDLFSSLSIVLDKPFVIGDFVIFDDFMGSIEHIGIKTTRIRSLTGEQIICANGDLLNTRIRNFKRMHERRVVFKVGVVYQTQMDKLQKIPDMIREIIESQEYTRFDRAHFSSYSDFALLFEIVYYVLSPDYNLYMDIQQTINLEIFKRFQAAGIDFAYPTQSLYIRIAQSPIEPATKASAIKR
ncbi:MAG: mechanosensitive ion channel domain-containing protein [Gammaproteobacteria bacterium]